MAGESGGTRKVAALFGVLLMVVSVVGAPVGAETLSGGVAQAGNVGTSPGVLVNDATLYNGTDSTVEVAYDGGTADPSDLQIVLLDAGNKQIAANASLTSQSGVAKLTVPAGIPADVSVTAVLADNSTAPPTQLASDGATFTVKTLQYASWVNRTNATHDPTTDTTLDVQYNATGQVGSATDLAVRFTDGGGQTVAANASLTSTEGVAEVTVPGGTFSSDALVAVELRDTNKASTLAFDTFTLTASGGGGGDTAPPAISNVQFTNNSGDMYISFESNESLGTTESDITVTVTAPNDARYTFGGTTFVKSGSGPYTYQLAVTQPFVDGAGTYTAEITDALDPAGNNGGTNGAGSGLTATADYKSGGGGGGGDTAPPKIANVQFQNMSGYMYVTFGSNETLGTSTADVLVEVTGPNGSTYTFDRSEFGEKGSGPYTYEISTSQQFTDGAGTYTVEVLDAVDPAGNNGGTNGAGSSLTASVAASGNGGGGGGGGGSDTAAPNVTSVDVSKNFEGNLSVVFTSNESLGTSAGDVTVTVDGPKNTDVYTFDRTQFTERFAPSGYEYELTADQPFDDGDGYYNATVDVAKDPAGNDAGSADLNGSFLFIDPKVNSSSVSIVSGPGDEGKIDLNAFYASGLLQIQVQNESMGYELEDAGLTKDTKLQMTVEVKSKKPRALIGNGRNVNWTRTQNPDGNWTITITGTPSETDYYFPFPNKWTGGLTATTHRNVSMTFASDTLSTFPAERRDSLSGIVFMTDAQSFAPPKYNTSGANPKIEFDVSAPHYTKRGDLNNGFAEVYLPQSLLDYWGVSGSAIEGQYNGQSRTTTLTNVQGGGVQASVDVHYSSGTAAFTVDSTAPAAEAGSDVTVEAGDSVSFDGSSSSDNREIDAFDWDFDGDGKTDATGVTPSTSFLSTGTHTVELTVTDAAGNTDTDTLTVTVEDTTAPTASVGSDRSITVGDVVSFDASGSMDVVGITSYQWDFDGDDQTDATGATPTHTFDSAGSFTVTLTVADAAGNTDTATLTVDVSESSGGGSGGNTGGGSGGSGGPEVTTTTSTTTAEPTMTEEPTTTAEPTTVAPTTTVVSTTPPQTEEPATETATATPGTDDGSTTAGTSTASDDDGAGTTDAAAGDAATTEGQEQVDAATASDSGESPGFGVAVALVALLAAAGLARRRDE